MVARIVDETNLYSTYDVNRGSISTCPEEIEHFLGILLQMCIVQMPRYRMYWQSSTRYEQVANIMSRDRFELIKRFLHFEDNSNAPDPKDPNKDKLFKVRKLFEMLRQNCLKVKPEEHNSVDEQIIPFKGTISVCRYLPKKPMKWGYKVLSRNGVSGFCYDFILDGAPDPSREEFDSIGFVSGDIVLRLCSTLPSQMSYKAYFDNYFTFLEFLQKLKEWGIWAVGTMRQDRMRGCELQEEKVLKKEGKGL
ncbi:piggyBac transposable element-derived protein 3-like [Rhopilema esculentum]|uniref:piggyBac transposable element-derived protein 3-like n=1 Tax=Rhopilema esculentum TaxID=499914 RepID=UPI0031DE1691